mgnify:FL=1
MKTRILYIAIFRSTIFFVVKPSIVSCHLARILPGLAFSMMYGSVLMKTNRIARILARGKKKIITRKPRCVSTWSLMAVTGLLVAVEVAMIIAMLALKPAEARVSSSEL